MSAWGSAQTADGRTYYFNKQTKETTWTKPADFDDSEPPATPATPSTGNAADWAEAKTQDGRTYYYNKVTKQTTWTLPPELARQQQAQQNGRPDFVAGGGGPGFGGDRDFGGRDRRDDRGHGLPQKPSFDGPRGDRGGGGGGGMPWEARQESMGFRGPMPVKTDEPDYATPEQAEDAFFKLLKRNNITPETEWHDALRTVIRDREYRAIKDPKDRKIAFEKYQAEVKAQEKEKEKERKTRVREEFRRMLSTHDEIDHYTRWKTARPVIEREAVFKSAGDEDERRRIFDEYILELKKKHVEEEAAQRRAAMQELDNMLKVLIIDPDTRWADAEDKIMSNERFVSDDTFKDLPKVDIFSAYENHMKALERVANDAIQTEKRNKYRRQRQARDNFKQLLHEKLREGRIKAGTKWQDFFPQIKDDERFIAYLGVQQGSEAIELFWDVVEDEERKLRSKRNDALDVLEDKRWEMTLETSVSEFLEVMRSHPKTAKYTEDDLQMIFDRLMEKVKRRADDNKIEAERHQKVAVDNLRSAMKKLNPPVAVSDSYDDIASRLVGMRDFENADEEVRRRAYDKFMTRLREREEHERDRRRERSRDRRRDDRDRGDRGDRERRHRTRTPEVDAYEADRRKAQADRERQYRKASFGLTPPPRDRRDDRYDDRRDDRRRPDPRDMYERERREREHERERNYLSRADPRDKGRTLDYGDEDQVGSRPPSVRKRRESDGSMSSRRDNKRPRRTHSPEPSLLKEEPPELQSGSEEGEIEEV
ncbi:Pre-mRNA-processing protein prp40 [Pseudocercospora fuligena]|uniref:Pre-mRNA-processing protein prp40 n=1 Tax=Pseudocercospora fuligena TaxID=685502 RepID=A0A8H6RI48_9PEZI|nr:Pre-mRNA-processing protein prp40 [Pseudocercospora fuligena]